MSEIPCSAYAYSLQCEKEDAARKEKERHNATMESTAKAVLKENQVSEKQLTELQTQNELLRQQIEQSKNDAEEAKKEAKRNKVFAWVSFGVGTAIGIAGIVIGIFL